MLTNFFYTLLGRIVKELLLPEIKKLIESETNVLRDEIKDLKDIVFDQSKRIDQLGITLNTRIDETNKRIDENTNETNKRFDEINKNIAFLTLEMGNIKKELEKLKRDEPVTNDILYRLRELEKRIIAA